MKKLTFILVALAFAVTASAAPQLKMNRAMKSNKLTKTENTQVNLNEVKQAAVAPRIAVITDQPEGELRRFNRSGQAIYADYGIYVGDQTKYMDIVFADDNKVYLKDILYGIGGYYGHSWVEGELSGDAISVPLFQSIYWSDDYMADVVIAFGETYIYETEDGTYVGFNPDLDRTVAMYMFTDQVTIELADAQGPREVDPNNLEDYEQYGLGCFWTDDDSFGGFLEWNTLLTETEIPEIPNVITEQPAGEELVYRRDGGCVYSSFFGLGVTEQEGKMHVVFADNGKAYIQNPLYWCDYYDTWVEGDYDAETGIITVPLGQYLTYSEDAEYGIQMTWGSSYVTESEEEGSYYFNYEISDRETECQFQIEDNTITLMGSDGDVYAEFPDNYVATGLIGNYSDDLSFICLEFNTTGSVIELFPAVPANATADEWYDCGDESGYSRFYFTLPTEDIDGNPLDEEYLSYSIFTDDNQLFTFEGSEDAYYFDMEVGEVMTEVPYSFYTNAVDFSYYYVYFYRTNEGDNPFFNHRIGIQVYYTVNGIKNASQDIVYLEVFPDPTSANELNADKAVASVRYFNVAGQEIAEPSGVTIKVTTYTDGTTNAVKVVK